MRAVITTKPNRCTECGKILRSHNKSKMCQFHYQQDLIRSKRKNLARRNKRIKKRIDFCSRCGAGCSGKLLIEIRKGLYYGFCSDCFEKVRVLKLKQIREIIYKTNI